MQQEGAQIYDLLAYIEAHRSLDALDEKIEVVSEKIVFLESAYLYDAIKDDTHVLWDDDRKMLETAIGVFSVAGKHIDTSIYVAMLDHVRRMRSEPAYEQSLRASAAASHAAGDLELYIDLMNVQHPHCTRAVESTAVILLKRHFWGALWRFVLAPSSLSALDSLLVDPVSMKALRLYQSPEARRIGREHNERYTQVVRSYSQNGCRHCGKRKAHIRCSGGCGVAVFCSPNCQVQCKCDTQYGHHGIECVLHKRSL